MFCLVCDFFPIVSDFCLDWKLSIRIHWTHQGTSGEKYSDQKVADKILWPITSNILECAYQLLKTIIIKNSSSNIL